MLMNKEEFMEVKAELVDDVLERLRDIARREAQLNPHVPMPDVAVNISKSITRVGDFFLKALEENYDILDADNKRSLVEESLPKKLVEVAGSRLIDDLPEAYVKAMIAASLASKMVYAEGVDFVDGLSEPVLAEAACSYINKTDMLRELIDQVESSADLGDKERILSILRH